MGQTFLSCVSFLSVVCLFVASTPIAARAQAPDAVGVRAQGMGGAFTAVADDATATWWNPAGLATGAYFNMLVEYGQSRPTDAGDIAHRAIALAFPALGLSYYRMTVSEIRPSSSTDPTTGSRQEEGTSRVRAVDVSQFGATVGQSLGGHLVLASTLKLIRAAGETHGGLDIGAMAISGILRVGVLVRNVNETTVGAGEEELTLRRHARAGAALTSAAQTALGGVTLAVDGDLQRVPTATGDERRIAVGGEVWNRTRVIGGRAGFSASTVGETRSAATAGVSVAFRPGLFVDGQLTGGSDETRKGWTVGLRVTF